MADAPQLTPLATPASQPPRSALVSSHSLPSIHPFKQQQPQQPPQHPQQQPQQRPKQDGRVRPSMAAQSRASAEPTRVRPALEPMYAGQPSNRIRRPQPQSQQRDASIEELPTRSPLLALEMELLQAKAGDEKVAACFKALRGLGAVISRPLQPLLEMVSKDLWMTAAQDHAAAAEEVRHLRSALEQRDADLAGLRAELEAARVAESEAHSEVSRLNEDNAHLREQLERHEAVVVDLTSSTTSRLRHSVGGRAAAMGAMGMMGALPRGAPAAAAAKPREKPRESVASLTSQMSGRSVFDRVEEAAGSLRAPKEKAHRQRMEERTERSLSRHSALDAMPGAHLQEEEAEGAAAPGESGVVRLSLDRTMGSDASERESIEDGEAADEVDEDDDATHGQAG